MGAALGDARRVPSARGQFTRSKVMRRSKTKPPQIRSQSRETKYPVATSDREDIRHVMGVPEITVPANRCC